VNSTYIISGTDTGIGKTLASAMLTRALGATYWKPIQAGMDEGTDTETVRELTGLSEDHFLQEAYRLSHPLSPHRSAELDGTTIDLSHLALPTCERTLIVEGAGGLMVPITRQLLQIDLFASWGAPVILCARTGLGTINHTLLSVEALRARSIPLLGLIFIGDENSDNMATIAEISGARVLGHLPILEVRNAQSLDQAFSKGFHLETFSQKLLCTQDAVLGTQNA